jgi:acetyl/propionyl-CoA carboxylase alpha subunit
MQDSETISGNGCTEEYQIRWGSEDIRAFGFTGGVRFLKAAGSGILPDISSGIGKVIHVLINGRSMRLEHIQRTEDGDLVFRFNGIRYRLPVMNRRESLFASIQRNQKEDRKQTALKAPIPGLVLKVMVSEGLSVQAGDPLLVLESMKMENVLRTQSSCTVVSLGVQPGETVEKGQVLIKFM